MWTSSYIVPASNTYPLYPNAIILPALAFPAWLLCIPPFIWHWSQRNIAAASLILWTIVVNFFNSINPLIWPRDNVDEWWDGNVWCDVHARIQVAITVAMAACVAMIMRRLANVMDTRNITLSPSKNFKRKERALECFWCWGYPLLMVILYWIVQPVRYFIFSISGCLAGFDESWLSIVLVWMWGPITMIVAAYYAGLLMFRLQRYRREFHSLIAARNTTKSRFMRLLIMSMIVIVICLPYNIWILYLNASMVDHGFSWAEVHGPLFSEIIKVPTGGAIRLDRWGHIALGYIAFFIFGTGTDANNTYKRLLCAIGLGKIFPSLYRRHESGSSTPSSFTAWTSSWSSKAKHLFSKNESVAETRPTQNGSISADTHLTAPITARSGSYSLPVHQTSTNEPLIGHHSSHTNTRPSFLARFNILARCNRQAPGPILPICNRTYIDEETAIEKSPATTLPPSIYAKAWVSASPSGNRGEDGASDGVRIVKEVYQDTEMSGGKVGGGDDEHCV
ncbi:STE3-domain-containing protein [Amniculicola lignicola CBS 123094]|uniref:STE3-domain-containing protein n=1 Tax=Amniculicola lignicola CBS 123094 TaxID=1392246 RepID=A0A6A5WZ55_9PLEO|nr:STE3-domain-containing protein [Amniculicola lignicola CBS 123094]